MIIINAVFALSAGIIASAGLFALISTVGVIRRFAMKSNTSRNFILYETMLQFGAIAGNTIYLWVSIVNTDDSKIQIYNSGIWGIILTILWGLLSGIFVGCFAVSLAETVKAIPTLLHRTGIVTSRSSEGMFEEESHNAKLIGFIVLIIAFGKGIGGLIFYVFI